MQEKTAQFRASSGRTVTPREDGSVVFDHANGYLGRDEVFDAEEFFRAREDERLGRWRFPLDPRFVVYRFARSIRVVDEADGAGVQFNIDEITVDYFQGFGPYSAAAQAFFEAHPERPAANAKAGEVWELTIDDGSEHTVFIHEDRTTGGRDGVSAGGAYFDIDDASNIIAARKVWGPEDAS